MYAQVSAPSSGDSDFSSRARFSSPTKLIEPSSIIVSPLRNQESEDEATGSDAAGMQ